MKPSIALLVWLVPVSVLAADKAPALSPEAWAQYKDAVAKVQAGAHGPATELLNVLAGQYPRVPEIFATRCSAQIGLRHFPAAEADCGYALAVRPNMPSALYGLAVAEEGQGKTDLAITHYRKYGALDDPLATYKAQANARIAELEAQSQALPVPPPPAVGGPVAQEQQAAGTGTLFVYRNHMMAGTRRGGYQHISLVLDGKLVGDLGHDQFVEIQVGQGNHLLEAHFAVDNIFEIGRVLSLPIDVTLNGQAYANFDTNGGQLVLQAVPAEQGRKEIRDDCKKAFTRKM